MKVVNTIVSKDWHLYNTVAKDMGVIDRNDNQVYLQ